MFEMLGKIWYTIAILPFLIFLEGDKKLSSFLKKKNIYSHWDVWHTALLVLIFLLFFLLLAGFR